MIIDVDETDLSRDLDGLRDTDTTGQHVTAIMMIKCALAIIKVLREIQNTLRTPL